MMGKKKKTFCRQHLIDRKINNIYNKKKNTEK